LTPLLETATATVEPCTVMALDSFRTSAAGTRPEGGRAGGEDEWKERKQEKRGRRVSVEWERGKKGGGKGDVDVPETTW
jgi:hypothetical protein